MEKEAIISAAIREIQGEYLKDFLLDTKVLSENF